LGRHPERNKGGDMMATYIMLVKYTQKGIETSNRVPHDLTGLKAFKAMGEQMKEFTW
jgi:uncharacterized protein with GYD domain